MTQATQTTQTAYCYHCGVHHAVDTMRQIDTKTGKRWRCIKSIEASRQGRAEREAFGRRMTENNKAEAQARLRIAKAVQQ